MTSRTLAAAGITMVLGGCATPPAKPAPENVSRAYHCLRDTGTRIPLPAGRCAASSGRVYTSEDLRRTGAIDAGEALNRLGVY